ncbi:MAG: endonuclease III [Patescibacteria group bacterium]|nr:endonuclease III [Patescibacteria group bacterium]MDE2438674.1 endonuclease III [Patescibacteria group bacterium]
MNISHLAERKLRAKHINAVLKRLFPHAKMMLHYSNNWELLVAVMLSAQCTDKKVNEVTATLFKKYKRLDDYVHANTKEFERDIHSTGFYHAKARHILASAKILYETFKGKVPRTMDELTSLPGVARKTANIVLGNAFGIVEGIAVDTHVKRLARVLGLTDEHDPNKIERDLMQLFPKKDWFALTYRLIEYGRHYCPAKPHHHAECPLTKIVSSL